MKPIVLFVDDQDEILFLIKRMLKNEPYDCLFASSAKEALDLIENNAISVLVTDVIMPDISGLELLEMVRKSKPLIVRIVLSGFSQIPTLLNAINKGEIFRYITKPWQVDAEAKAIITDAIEYAQVLRRATSKDTTSIMFDEFKFFLMEKDEKCIVTYKDKISYLHPVFQDQYAMGDVFKGPLDDKKMIGLNKDMKVYICEK